MASDILKAYGSIEMGGVSSDSQKENHPSVQQNDLYYFAIISFYIVGIMVLISLVIIIIFLLI